MADVEWVKYIIMTIKNYLRKTCFQISIEFMIYTDIPVLKLLCMQKKKSLNQLLGL